MSCVNSLVYNVYIAKTKRYEFLIILQLAICTCTVIKSGYLDNYIAIATVANLAIGSV